MAGQWGAILYVDEADSLMAERAEHQEERNAMVSMFLRIVEYFDGVLILTTNRVKHLDLAVFSRLHQFVSFPQPNLTQRAQIWRLFVRKAGGDNIDERCYTKLAEKGFNGREVCCSPLRP